MPTHEEWQASYIEIAKKEIKRYLEVNELGNINNELLLSYSGVVRQQANKVDHDELRYHLKEASTAILTNNKEKVKEKLSRIEAMTINNY